MKNWPWAVLSPAILFVLIGLFAPLLMTDDPIAQDYGALLTGPSWDHWLGTDYLGRDMFSRIICCARSGTSSRPWPWRGSSGSCPGR